MTVSCFYLKPETSNYIVVRVFGIETRLFLSQQVGFDGRCKGRVPVSASAKSDVPVNLQFKQSSFIVIFFFFFLTTLKMSMVQSTFSVF